MEWISSGYRQRFTICSKAEILAWVCMYNEALENAKSNDACKEYKAAIDGGMANDSVPDLLMAKLIKSWLLVQKQEQIEIRTGGKAKEPVQDALNEAEKKKPTEKDSKGNAPTANAKKPPPKGSIYLMKMPKQRFLNLLPPQSLLLRMCRNARINFEIEQEEKNESSLLVMSQRTDRMHIIASRIWKRLAS
jgi:hypothetical protein